MTEAVVARTPAASAGVWGGRVLSALFVLFMAFDIAIKLVDLPVVRESLRDLGYPVHLGRFIGVMELLFVALYLWPRTAVLGAVLMTGLLGGAVASHVRVEDPLFSHILFGVYLGLFAWGGLYLRDERLRSLFPLRR